MYIFISAVLKVSTSSGCQDYYIQPVPQSLSQPLSPSEFSTNLRTNDGQIYKNPIYIQSDIKQHNTFVPLLLQNGNRDSVGLEIPNLTTYPEKESTKVPQSALFNDKIKCTDIKISQLKDFNNLNNNLDCVLKTGDLDVKQEHFEPSDSVLDINNKFYNTCSSVTESSSPSDNIKGAMKRKLSPDHLELSSKDIATMSISDTKRFRPNDTSSISKTLEKTEVTVIESKPSKRPSALVETIDYKLLEGKKDIELLTAIEMQTNVNLAKMELNLSSSSEFSNSEKESPRKAQRTRSFESAVRELPEERSSLQDDYSMGKDMKRSCSVQSMPFGVEQKKIDFKADTKPKIVSVPVGKHNKKETKSNEKRDDVTSLHKTDHHKTSSRGDKNRRYINVGIQARPSRDYARRNMKLIEPRPCLTLSGNFTHPPDVS